MHLNKKLGLSAALILLASCAIPAAAHSHVDANWIGGNGYWDDSTHWSGGVVPDNVFGDYRAFLYPPYLIVAIRQDVTVGQVNNWVDLKLVNGATLTVESNMVVYGYGRVEGRGAIQALRVANYGEIFASGYGNSLTVTSTRIDNSGLIYASDYGKLTIVDATIDCKDFIWKLYAEMSGTLVLQDCNITAGTMEIRGDNAQGVLVSSAVSVQPLKVLGNGMLRVTGGTSEVANLILEDAAGVAVIDSNATLILHDTSCMGTILIGGTAKSYGGVWASWGSVVLSGGCIQGNLTNYPEITSYGGQIDCPESSGGLRQNGGIQVARGVLELRPRTLVNTSENIDVDADGELFVNNATIAGDGGPINVTGTLRLNNAVLRDVDIWMGGTGYGGGPVGANMYANGNNDLTAANVTIYEGAAADIQSGTTAFPYLVNRGVMNVRSGATMLLSDPGGPGGPGGAGGACQFVNCGTVNIAGVLDSNSHGGYVENNGVLNVLPGGVLNFVNGSNGGTIFVDSGGVLNIGSVFGECGEMRIRGTLNAQDLESGHIVLEGGSFNGATRHTDISGYGTITGNHSGVSIYNEVNGRTLLITDAMLQIDGGMRADYGGKISIVNSVINMDSRDDEGGPDFIVQGYEPYPAFSQLTVRDSGLIMNGQVGQGGFLLTLGTVELKNVDVATGMMAVLGETSMARLRNGGLVYVAPGHKLTVQSVQNDGDMDVAGELHFRTEDFGSPCWIEGGGWFGLAGGSITGEAQVTSTAGGEGIRGYGRISVALINYGNVSADAPGSWLKLDVNDKVNYGLIAAYTTGAPEGGKLSVEGIRLDNYGTIQVDADSELLVKGGTIDTKDTNGHIYNAGRITVESGGTINLGTTQGGSSNTNDGEIFVASGGALNLIRTSLEGSGYVRVAGTLNADDVEIPGSGGGAGIVMEGGVLAGATRIGRDICGYGTITGNHTLSGGSIYNEENGRTLLITDAMLQIDGGMRADYGGKISIVNSVINMNSQDDEGGPSFIVQGYDPYPAFSQLTVRDSGLLMDGQVGPGGFLFTLGTVELNNVDVAGGMMVVMGETSMGRLSTSGPFEGSNVYVAPGHKLTVETVWNEDGLDIAGELHFRTMDSERSCRIDGNGWFGLAGGSITGEVRVTSTLGGDGIRGYGRISVPLINYGNVSADAPGSWLKLDVNDKANYGMISAETTWTDGNRAPEGGRLSVEGIRLDNYGLVYIDSNSHLLVDAGVIDNKEPNGLTRIEGTYELRRGGAILGSVEASAGSLGILGACGQEAQGVNSNRFALGKVDLAGGLNVMNPGDSGYGAADANGTIVTAASLDIHSGGEMRLLVGGRKVLLTKGLSIDANNSRLDVGDNDAVVDYGAENPMDGITALIRSGFNDYAWNGYGIASSAAANDTRQLTAIGVLDNALYGYTDFAGQPVDETSVLIKYTWYGDADLNGEVNYDDYLQWEGGLGGSGTGWLYGDFDYSGEVNYDDYLMWEGALGGQTGILSEGLRTAVPEPGTMLLLGAGAGLALLRRRSRVASA